MNAIAIGPLVFAPDRFAAIAAIFAFLAIAWMLSLRRMAWLTSWSWWAVIVFVAGARAGHVVANAAAYLQRPWDVFAIWQGGFNVAIGIAAAAVFSVSYLARRKAKILVVLLPTGGAAVVALSLLAWGAGTPALPLPRSEPLPTLAGSLVSLDNYKGKPLVLNLWATWCPPCRREMPMLVQAAKESTDVEFVFVNQFEDRSRIQSYLASEGLPLDQRHR